MADMMICPNCSSANQVGTRFCINCGANLLQTPVQASPALKCTHCGADLPSGAGFCSRCGVPVQSQNPLEPPGNTQPPHYPLSSFPNQFYVVSPQQPIAPPVDPTKAPRLNYAPSIVRLGQVERPRGCYLTGLTTLGFFVTGVQVIAFMVLAAAADLMPGFPAWYPAVNSFNNLVCLIGFIGLYNWKKWGASVVLITLIGGLLLSIDAILTIYESAIYTDNSVNIILGLVTGISIFIILMVIAGVLPKWKYLE